jgi:hypothetical protein
MGVKARYIGFLRACKLRFGKYGIAGQIYINGHLPNLFSKFHFSFQK